MSDSKHSASISSEEKRALLVQLLEKKIGKQTASLLSRLPQRAQLFLLQRVRALDQLALSVTELEKEVVLDPAIRPEAVPLKAMAEPAHIFLTGATGFLGAFLLYELLAHTQANVYCLVRAANVTEGKKRIEETLKSYLIWNEHLSSRIVPVVGDLSLPLFGLSAQEFHALAEKIDTIYHNGAFVNWLYPYERLKPANVLGTQEVLRLASQVSLKPLHFISTLGVFPVVGDSTVQVIREQDPLDHGGVLYGGYHHSKWVADKLVTIARSRGLPVRIYRPGLITGHSQTGAANIDDVFCSMMKSWIELGSAPDLDGMVNLVPVDYVSKAIVHLSRQRDLLGECFHLANPRPVPSRYIVSGMRSFGYPIQVILYDRWRAELLALAARSQGNALNTLAPLLAVSVSHGAKRLVEKIAEFDCTTTLQRLAGTSIVCPPIDSEVLDAYFSYFIRRGFLPAPQSVAQKPRL